MHTFGLYTVYVHRYVDNVTYEGSRWIYFTITVDFFFLFTLDFPINFNFSWQPLTAKTEDFFFHFIETDWPRVLLPSTDSGLHLLAPLHPPPSTRIHIHNVNEK